MCPGGVQRVFGGVPRVGERIGQDLELCHRELGRVVQATRTEPAIPQPPPSPDGPGDLCHDVRPRLVRLPVSVAGEQVDHLDAELHQVKRRIRLMKVVMFHRADAGHSVQPPPMVRIGEQQTQVHSIVRVAGAVCVHAHLDAPP
ncbi:hypothetical protein [Nocardia sp. NPDC004604]|uniref:hypothetical protein n=1 Tax=Nocardia sp. NPDC004604 TaxID=3157013 RepID=UPI0033A2E239